MKKLLLFLFALAPLSAQVALYTVPQSAGAAAATTLTGNAGLVQIKPQAIPTVQTVITKVDAYIQGIAISNNTASAITVTLLDGQGSAVPLLPATSIAASSTTVVNVPFLYWCPNGFTIQASGAGAFFYATWRQ